MNDRINSKINLRLIHSPKLLRKERLTFFFFQPRIVFPAGTAGAFSCGKWYLPAQSAIAFYHVNDKLPFSKPLGEIKDDVNPASCQFRKKDGSYVFVESKAKLQIKGQKILTRN